MKTEKELIAFNKYLESDKFILHPTYAEVIGQPSEEEYFSAIRALSQMEGSVHWCIGDIANSYVGQYGSMARLAHNVGYSCGTVYNDRLTVGKYEVSWRHEILSFEHHRVAVPWKDREDWLKKAEENGWSVSQMQAARKKEKGTASPNFDDFRRAASELLSIADGLLQEYKKSRRAFRDEFEEIIEQLLHEVEGLQFEVSITKYRYTPEPLTRKDFELEPEESLH